MFSTKRYAAVMSSLLLCLVASHAVAADRTAKLDPKDCEKPEFPVRWQADGISGGDVLVAYLVGSDGKVMDSKVVQSSGTARIDRASVKAGARCKFEPGAKNGQAEPSWAKVRYTWLID
jgi:protein TonB